MKKLPNAMIVHCDCIYSKREEQNTPSPFVRQNQEEVI